MMTATYQEIKTTAELASYCDLIKNAKHVSLDTEFVRRNTFYPALGIIQITDGTHAAIIDPLNITSWQCFVDILTNQNIEKSLHACSEDLELFSNYFNVIPSPVVDSQIFAAFLDNPMNSGFSFLTEKYLNVTLDKSQTLTNWLKRPLTKQQLDYAVNDVAYLFPLIHILKDELAKNGWLDAAYDESYHFVNKRAEQIHSYQTYLNFKDESKLSLVDLSYLKALAKWRLEFAKEHDIACNLILKKEHLFSLAKHKPSSLRQLAELNLDHKIIRLYGKTVLSILAKKHDLPDATFDITKHQDYKKLSQKIKIAIDEIAKKMQLSSQLLASKKQIDKLIAYQIDSSNEKPELLQGWRYDLFKPYFD